MPRGDGTGPIGMGSMTGRGAGYCTGYSVPGFANNAGFGFGRGMRAGRGFRRMFCRTGFLGGVRMGYPRAIPNEPIYDEKKALQDQEQFLENQLKQIKDLLKNFEEEK